MKKLVIILLIFLFPLEARSEIKKITSLEAVNIALENNLELQAKKKDVEIKYQEIKMANALKNPQFQSNFLMGKVTRGNSSQFGGSLPIELFKRKPRKEAEIAKLRIIEEEISTFEHQIKINVLKAYFNVLYAKSILKISQEREKIFKIIEDISKQKTKSISYEADVLQSSIKRNRQLVFINRAQAKVQIAQLAFNDAFNLKDDEIMYDTIEDSLFDDNVEILDISLPDYPLIEKIALKYSHNLKIADLNTELSKKDLKIQERKIIPDVSIGGGTAYQTAHQSKTEALPGAYVGVYVDIPLLYQYQPEINRAKKQIEKSKINKESYESHLKYALKEDYNKYKYAKINMNHYQQILKDSDKVLDIYTKKYKQGQATLLNVVQIENAHKETVVDYLLAMENFYSAYLDLMFNIGHDILLDDDAL